MRRLSVRLSACIVAVGLFIICTVAFAEARKPRLEVLSPEYNFGSVRQGDKVEHAFVVKNAGTAELRIERMVPACGCTITSASQETIAPGNEAAVTVVFDTSGFSGEKVKTVRVYTNDLEQPWAMLSLKGTVVPEVIVEPRALRFGEVIKGREAQAKQIVTARVSPGSSAEITGVRSFSNALLVEEIESGKGVRKFSVAVKPDTPVGILRERIVIGLRGAEQKTVNVPVFATVEGHLRLTPATLSFGVISGDAPLTRGVKLQNFGSGDIALTAVSSNHPALTVKYEELKPGREYRIDVAVDPTKVDKDLRTTLAIRTSSDEQNEITLNVYGVLPPKV